MEILTRITQLILSLSILIVLHEFGHYLFARIFKTRVEKFYLFFDPWFSIFKFKYKETEYGIGWLPLGGYVKISGMIDESLDRSQLNQPAQWWEFRSKPAWQRLLIMLGGVMVNFILALIIYSMVLYVWGEEYLANKDIKYGISCEASASEIGLCNGDKVIWLDGKEVQKFTDIVPHILLDNVKKITVLRGADTVNISIPPSLIPRLVKGEPFISFRFPFIIGGFAKESAGEKAGLAVGDKIISIGGDSTIFFDEVKSKLTALKGQETTIGINRNGQTMYFQVFVPESGLLGIASDLNGIFTLSRNEYSFFESFPAGIAKGFKTARDYLKQFRLLFSRESKAYESVGGFITIGKIFPAQWNWLAFWNLTAFLSIMLAILNVLPIPALDGGHVMFLLYEIITRRKPSDKFLEYAQITGMIILFALLIWANLNDILKLFK